MEDVKRKLTAILIADVKNYSLLTRDDEPATVRTLTAYLKVMTMLVKQHRGRVVDSQGDNLLAEFASVVDAVQGAVAIQKELKARNAELPENRKMEFRIGINLGDVIVEGEQIYGDGVNIAARLESIADPGGICISRTAYDQIEYKLPLGYEYLGEKTVKNIPNPIRAYRVLIEPREAAPQMIKEKRSRPKKSDKQSEDMLKEKPAEPRANAKNRFYKHLGTYLGVTGFFLIVNLLTYKGKIWFHWIALVWGLVVYLRWLTVFPSLYNRFYRQLGACIGVTGFFLIVNILTYKGKIWFYWPGLIWGLVLFLRRLWSFSPPPRQ
jgi:class 3 adenylate cyclase